MKRRLLFLLAVLEVATACSSNADQHSDTPGSSESANAVDGDAGDATRPEVPEGYPADPYFDADAGRCVYPPATNDARCPSTYHYGTSPAPGDCPELGLQCWYPGFGDGKTRDGCYAPALYACVEDKFRDGGSPDLPGKWVGAN